ncbi:MAG: YdeI/OmpD-associated family protein [Thermoplasmata archaeon]
MKSTAAEAGANPRESDLERRTRKRLRKDYAGFPGSTDVVAQKKQEATTGAVHRLPVDFQHAIESDPMVREAWADITPLARNEWICWVTSAKKDETRNRRIIVGLDKMRKGMRRPCCWAGCPHR